ncbi:hypothetical protein V8G54_013675, partial [Vigna mungo]
ERGYTITSHQFEIKKSVGVGRRRPRGSVSTARRKALERLKVRLYGGRRFDGTGHLSASATNRRAPFIVNDGGIGYGHESEEEDWSQVGFTLYPDESDTTTLPTFSSCSLSFPSSFVSPVSLSSESFLPPSPPPRRPSISASSTSLPSSSRSSSWFMTSFPVLASWCRECSSSFCWLCWLCRWGFRCTRISRDGSERGVTWRILHVYCMNFVRNWNAFLYLACVLSILTARVETLPLHL